MPTYVFECPKCKNQVELIQTVKEHEMSSPVCVIDGCDGQQFMRSVIHAPGLIFKGPGWTPKGAR